MNPFSPTTFDLIRALQGLGGWLSAPMNFFTFLGNEAFFLLVLPLVYWCVNKAIGTDLVLLLIFSNGLNGLAKGLVKLPRPYWVDPTVQLGSEDSFGMPSGHAMNAITLWGFGVAWLTGRRTSSSGARARLYGALMVLVILLISLSRLYLGVHSPGQVLGGWILGLVTLALYLWAKPRLAPVFNGLSLWSHVGLATVVALALLALYLGAAALPTGDPAAYGVLFATAQGQTYEAAATLAGMIWGIWIGLVLERRRLGFSATGPVTQRALRYVVGIIGVVVLWGGLKLIFPAELTVLGMALRVVRYAILMMWTAFFWPWLFVRLGWGTKKPESR